MPGLSRSLPAGPFSWSLPLLLNLLIIFTAQSYIVQDGLKSIVWLRDGPELLISPACAFPVLLL